MEKFVNLLSNTCVSVPCLLFFNLLVFTINARFINWLTFLPTSFDKINTDEFHDIASPLAVRLITVGVLILERHDVLEISGLVPKGSANDEISEKTHPFGTFYLCFGLFMECFIEQIHIPGKIFDIHIVTNVVVWSSYIIGLISLLACLKLFHILFSHYKVRH